MSRKVFIIWNPASGGKSSRTIKSLKRQLNSESIEYDIFDTSDKKNATYAVRENLKNTFTDLIIIGGDGTINEAINGLEFDIPVSIIPTGTGNDFVKMLDLGSNLNEIITTAIHGQVKSIDLGVCNGRKFLNGVGIGFDGQIVEDMATKRIPLLKGHAAYYYHVLRILGSYRERTFKYQLNDVTYQKDLILLTIGNGSTFGGGFKLMPNADIFDGLLEICEIGRVSPLKRFWNIPKLSTGTHGDIQMVNFYQTKEISIHSDAPLFAHIDGERMGSPPYHISISAQSLKLRAF